MTDQQIPRPINGTEQFLRCPTGNCSWRRVYDNYGIATFRDVDVEEEYERHWIAKHGQLPGQMSIDDEPHGEFTHTPSGRVEFRHRTDKHIDAIVQSWPDRIFLSAGRWTIFDNDITVEVDGFYSIDPETGELTPAEEGTTEPYDHPADR